MEPLLRVMAVTEKKDTALHMEKQDGEDQEDDEESGDDQLELALKLSMGPG